MVVVSSDLCNFTAEDLIGSTFFVQAPVAADVCDKVCFSNNCFIVISIVFAVVVFLFGSTRRKFTVNGVLFSSSLLVLGLLFGLSPCLLLFFVNI